jgi:hypothetical protein
VKRAHVLFSLTVLAAFAAVLLAPETFAQQPAPAPKIVQVRKLEQRKAATPEYQLLKGQFMGQTRDWFVATAQYRTAPEWIDELTFTYYILVRAKTGAQKFTLFKGDVTYVNIQKGDHKSDIYLHPSTLARYGDVERVAVVVNAQGRVVAMESLPSSNTRWWEQLTPVEGYALNRLQTPFAMINFDDYEAIRTAK